MPRIAKRAAGSIVPALTALTLAGCTAASVPPSYTLQSTGGSMAGPDMIGSPIPVILPPAPVDRQTQAFPKPRGILPPQPPAPPPPVDVDPPAAPLPVKNDPPPLVAIEPPALRFPPLVTPLTPPADATDCTGWWRICHAY
jgi:hypothetical protein